MSKTQLRLWDGAVPTAEAVAGTTLLITRSDLSFCTLQLATSSARSTRAKRVFIPGLLLALVAGPGGSGDDGLRAVDDARRDEDEQFGAVVRHGLLLEQPAQHRNLGEHRHLVPGLGVAAGVDAADHRVPSCL